MNYRIRILQYLASATVLGASLCHAAIYYVDGSTSSDSNPGTYSQPLLHIQHAVDQAISTNDTIYVKRGVLHTERVIILRKNGITLTTYGSGAKPIIDGYDLQPGGSGTTPGSYSLGMIDVRLSQNIVIENFHVQNSRHAGISVSNSAGPGEGAPAIGTPCDDITIRYCDTEDTAASGIVVTAQDAVNGTSIINPVTDVTVRNCTVDDANTAVNGAEAITFRRVHDLWCYDNDVTNNYKEGINVVDGCKDGYIYRNYVADMYDPTSGSYFTNGRGTGIYVDGAGASGTDKTENINISDNIIHDQANGIVINTETGGDIDGVNIYNNIVYNNKFVNFILGGDGGNNGGVWGDRKNVKVFNNTFVGDVANWIVRVIENNSTSSKIAGFEFKNNILYRASNQNWSMIKDTLTSTSYYTHNLYYNGGGTMTGNLGSSRVESSPSFTSKTWSTWPYSTNYYIPPYSAAVEAGTTLSIVTDDISGKSRPDGTTHDIGALEGDH